MTRSLITTITPLSSGTSRAAAVAFLHDHVRMIRLNPLVIRLQRTTPAPDASADEYDCAWYEITDEINYLPGGLYKGEVTYKACFNDLPNGLQTHTFAPAGLDLRGKWTIGGNEPGEPREKLELGTDAPREGLYAREDVDMRCNFLLAGFVKKNLTKSHKVVMDNLASLGQEGQPDEHVGQGHDGAGDGSAVPTPWRDSGRDRTLTPVDSNTMFGPDSYLRGPPRPDPSQPRPDDDPDLTDPAFHVGHHPSPRREEPRSHSHSPTNIRPRSPANVNSAQKLSYREHERRREHDVAPQLPQLGFLESGGHSLPGASQVSGRHFDSDASAPPSSYGFEHHTSILHGPSVPAELPAHNPPVDGSNIHHDHESAAFSPTPTNAKDSLQPDRRVNQRLSTDYTWRPGLKAGAFI